MIRSRRSKKLFAVSAIFLLLGGLAGSVYTVRQSYTITPEAVNLASQAGEAIPLPWPGQGVAAVGAVGYGLLADSGTSEKPAPIASVTKLFTALAVLEKKPLAPDTQGPSITLTAQDEAFYNTYHAQGGSVVAVRPGQQLTQYQALQALLLPSANNIADTLVVWAFDSTDAYLAYAKQMLQEHGFTHTVLADASGFSPLSVSSSRDLVQLGEIVMKQTVIAQIINQPTALLDGIGLIQNTNRLLLGQHGIIGAKTGHTDEAGDCLLFMADYQKGEDRVTIIGVLLGQSDRTGTFAQAKALLGATQAGFSRNVVVAAQSVVGRYRTPWDTEVAAVTEQDISVFGWRGQTYKPDIHLEKTNAGVPTDHEVGAVTIQNGNHIQRAAVRLKQPLSSPSIWWRFAHILS